MYTQSLHLSGNLGTHIVYVLIIINGPQHHLPWKTYGTVQSHAQTPFRIHSEKKGNL